MTRNPFIDKAFFIKEEFIAAGLISDERIDEPMRKVTIFRRNTTNDSAFILLTIGYDFRDPEWSIDLSVGNGYPEQSEDPVELQIASISLVNLGKLDKSTHYLDRAITEEDLRNLYASGIEYCKMFIAGEIADAMSARSIRNLKQGVDPLALDSGNKQLKNKLESRNEELKSIYKKYL